jgi:putative tryptophan/tyrosine transport system substrate-binding protein
MASHIERRKFLATLGGAAAWPLAARAQQPVIGFLSSGERGSDAFRLTSFRQGLSEVGYGEGQNAAITYRWADGHYDRLPALAADLVSHKVAVIFASGGNVSALAAKAATATIPIVFMGGGDPVKLGLVTALNRPGGNVTGVSNFSNVLAAKRLELLHQLAPTSNVIAFLVNPDNPNAAPDSRDVQEAARVLGLPILVLNARGEADFDQAFASLVQRRARELVVAADPFSSIGASSLPRWLPAMAFWPSTISASSLKLAG